jgi:hypothetical protein
MNVATLGNSSPKTAILPQMIPFDNGYPRKVIGQYASDEQPRHTAPNDNGVF